MAPDWFVSGTIEVYRATYQDSKEPKYPPPAFVLSQGTANHRPNDWLCFVSLGFVDLAPL